MAVLSREQQDTSSTVLDRLSFNIPPETQMVTAQAVDGVIRYTLDGTTPTASLGFRLLLGKKPVEILVDDFKQIKYIRETVDAVLQVTYYAGRDVPERMDDSSPVDTGTDTRAGWRTENNEQLEWIDGS